MKSDRLRVVRVALTAMTLVDGAVLLIAALLNRGPHISLGFVSLRNT